MKLIVISSVNIKINFTLNLDEADERGLDHHRPL